MNLQDEFLIMLTREEVEHIAKLARLGLTAQEIEKFRKELSAILDYIGKLKEADISGVEPTSHSVLVENITRKDEVQNPKSKIQNLIDLMPETKDGYLKVKSVF